MHIEKYIKLVTQHHPMGCGVACVASVLRISYNRAFSLFSNAEAAWTIGFYCQDLVEALSKVGNNFEYRQVKSDQDILLRTLGTIVFTEPSSQYVLGHYLVRGEDQWMNPWFNYPLITPAKSSFVASLPGVPSWIIFQAA